MLPRHKSIWTSEGSSPANGTPIIAQTHRSEIECDQVDSVSGQLGAQTPFGSLYSLLFMCFFDAQALHP